MVSEPAAILIVEDDILARQSLAAILTQAGYRVLLANNVPEATTLLTASNEQQVMCDVVITDLILQEHNGLDILRVARTLENAPEVIFLTGYGTLETALEALRAGVYDYLLKPCNPEQLLKVVRGALQRRQERLSTADAIQAIEQNLARLRTKSILLEMPVGDFTAIPTDGTNTNRYLHSGPLLLDENERTVTINQQQIYLTPLEFTILQSLLRAQGKLIGYRELVRDVYGYDVSDQQARGLLKGHIHNLRYKIQPVTIKSVRGSGYLLVL